MLWDQISQLLVASMVPLGDRRVTLIGNQYKRLRRTGVGGLRADCSEGGALTRHLSFTHVI